MSIRKQGVFTRSAGVLSAITKEIRHLNFKAARRVTVQFDPFHEKAGVTRDFLSYISSAKVGLTNPNCVIKTEIVCARQNPTVTIQLLPAIQEALKIKTVKIDVTNLTTLELLKITNEQVSKRAPKEEAVSSIKTKSEKKSAGGGKRK